MANDVRMSTEQLQELIGAISNKKPSKEPKPEKESSITPYKIAQDIMQRYTFLSIGGQAKDYLLYVYNPIIGIYDADAQKLIRKETLNICKDATDYACKEVIHHIADRIDQISIEQLNNHGNLFNVRNGMLNLDTRELLEHDAKYFSTRQLALDYNPDAQCPKIEQFLNQIASPENVVILKEFIGFLLTAGYSIHKAIILVGTGNNGKTTFANLIKAFVGKGNYSTVPLQDLCTDKFARWNLVNRLTNIYDDLPSNAVSGNNLGKFKGLTGGSPIDVEKKFAIRIEIEMNTAKMIFTCNLTPPVHNADEAFWDRWIVIEFPNVFTVKDNSCDISLENKLASQEELEGMLVMAVAARKQLLANSKFSVNNNPRTIKEKWQALSGGDNSVALFIAAMVRLESGSVVSKDRLYEAYKRYCSQCNLDTKAVNAFHRQFKEIKSDVTEYYPSMDGKQVHCYQGIKIIYPEAQIAGEE